MALLFRKPVTFFACLSIILCSANAAVKNSRNFRSFAKKLTTLPGIDFSTIGFSQYSGFLQANEEKTRFLHFWFVESQRDPAKDPLLLWLQGGPGCSSIFGFLGENGPFRVDDDGKTLIVNPYSWNKVANVLYLEAPAGVGYSFASDGQTDTNDDQTATDNYGALKEFFRLFPQYKTREFYISGESYGGIYVPTLSVVILNGLTDFPINFNGAAIGNGWLSDNIGFNSVIQFYYGHGMVDEAEYRKTEDQCCNKCDDTCDFNDVQGDDCKNMVSGLGPQGAFTPYPYAIYSVCPNSTELAASPSFRLHHDLKLNGKKRPTFGRQSSSKNSDAQSHKAKSNGIQNPDPCCTNDYALTDYMNIPEVRKALFIPDDLPTWAECSNLQYQKTYTDMFKQVRQMTEAKGFRTMLYHGDVDTVCNFLMGQQFSKALNLKLLNDKTAWDRDNILAGYITRYQKLDFVTVLGSGHMVPACRAPQALTMISAFLANEPL